MKSNRKGQLDMLVPTILLLVVAGAILVLGLQLMAGFAIVTDDYVSSVVNESGTILTAGYTLAKSTAPGFTLQSISATNLTGTFAVIPSANYTVSSVGVVTNATPTVYTGAALSYTYTYGQESYKSANKTIVGVGSFADFWSLIVLAVVIAIVVGLLLMVMSSRRVQ
jgi:hypothetical protein